MAYADRRDDKIVVRTEYRDKDLIRQVPGARYDVQEHIWKVPLSWAGCLTLRGLFRERLDIGPALEKWAWHHRNDFVLPAMEMRTQLDAPGAEQLYGFQRAGVQFLSHARWALLTDEMGTGKTIQSIYTLRELEDRGEVVFPALIVAPNNMKGTWRREFKQWWPKVKVEVMEGSRPKRLAQIDKVASGKADVLVANWESLRGHSKLAPFGSTRLKHCTVCDPALRGDPEVEAKHKQMHCERCPRELNDVGWRSIIADEAHRAKEPKAKQTRALWALRSDKTIVRLALTGTPIANAPQDLWSSLHFINPDAWPARTKFIDRWCLQSFNPFGGMTIIGLKPETKDEFFAITDPHVIRRPKSLVLSQLPQKVYTQRYVQMSPKQAKAYKTMQDDMVAAIGEDGGYDERIVAVNPLTQLTRLSQFASAYAELDDEGNVRLTEPSNKIDALLEIFEEVGDQPIVVFAQSRQLIELASRRLEKDKIPHGMIVGGQTTDERQAVIDRFQRGDYRAVLATVQAGGVGITLTRANTLVFLQRSWSMVDNSQAEDRVHRIGSEIHDSITIVDIISEGTIEEGQRQALQAKTDRMQEIVRDADLLRKMLGVEQPVFKNNSNTVLRDSAVADALSMFTGGAL
jgi:SNF2 family DNA or RNA helicase